MKPNNYSRDRYIQQKKENTNIKNRKTGKKKLKNTLDKFDVEKCFFNDFDKFDISYGIKMCNINDT